MSRIALFLGALAATLAVGAGPAHAQYGPQTTTTVVGGAIPEITVVRGQSVEVGGDRCAPNAAVVVTFDDGRVLSRTRAGADGSFTVTVTVPADATLGRHLITATCKAAPGSRASSKVVLGTDGAGTVDADGYLRQYLYVEVVATASGPASTVRSGSALPRTGSSHIPTLLGLGAGALVLGAAFAYGTRRPRPAS